MQHPGNHSGKNDNPYSPYTQDAQNWEGKRLQAERKKQFDKDWHSYNPPLSSQAAAQSIAPPRKKVTPRPATKPITKKTNENSESVIRSIFGIAAFLFAAISIYRWDDEKWILALVIGTIAGGLAAKFYKGIIVIGVLIFGFYLYQQSK